MRLQRIRLVNIRNLRELDYSPGAGLNVIVGANAAGKTNFCEALHYAARGLLLKGERQRDLIRWGEQRARLDLDLTGDLLRIDLDAAEERKALTLNGERSRQSEVHRVWRALLFTPDELQMLKGSPVGRRRFLDQAVADLDPGFRRVSVEYDQLLRRKNALLKKPHFDRELLDVLNSGLIRRGAVLLKGRLAYIEALSDWLPQFHQRLAQTPALLTLNYQASVLTDAAALDESRLHAALADSFKEAQSHEIERGTSLVGPHRDDFSFHLDRADMRQFSSQGEQKTALIALLLAQLELMRQRFGDYPVLVLDDVLSELDGERSRRLLENLPEGLQIFLTAIELNDLLRTQAGRFDQMRAGELSPLPPELIQL
jgi:DNA replication and repair protein RecF